MPSRRWMLTRWPRPDSPGLPSRCRRLRRPCPDGIPERDSAVHRSAARRQGGQPRRPAFALDGNAWWRPPGGAPRPRGWAGARTGKEGSEVFAKCRRQPPSLHTAWRPGLPDPRGPAATWPDRKAIEATYWATVSRSYPRTSQAQDLRGSGDLTNDPRTHGAKSVPGYLQPYGKPAHSIADEGWLAGKCGVHFSHV